MNAYETYMELSRLDAVPYVKNVYAFQCPICYVECEQDEGVVLRNCLHNFCRDCLKQTIEFSEDPEVKCPYIDADYSCDSTLQEREVRALVKQEIFDKYLNKSIRLAETQTGNAFHCKTPNCCGWCIMEGSTTIFQCPVCGKENCMNCKAIHTGLTCFTYQEQLNPEATATTEQLKEMVQNGSAMHCPRCHVVVMKIDGCDWLLCTMCKTQICWVTRGARWGPNGTGDTTGGCMCNVGGRKCHPNCGNCH